MNQDWTDDTITAESTALEEYFGSEEVGIEVRQLCQRIRDDMQRKIDLQDEELAALKAELATLKAQGVPVDALRRLVDECDWEWIGYGIHRNDVQQVRAWLAQATVER